MAYRSPRKTETVHSLFEDDSSTVQGLVGEFDQHTVTWDFHSEKAKQLESQGPEVWLKTMWPWIFEEEFSDDHRKFWALWWSILMRLRQQRKWRELKMVPDDSDAAEAFFRSKGCFIEEDEWVIMLLLGRGLGKSATIEAASVMRGAMLAGGYCLYVCESKDQAEEHVGNMRMLIEDDRSRLSEFYPGMRIDPNAKVDGKRTRDRLDLFITVGQFIARAKGLAAKMRGLRIGTRRPDDINIDDIDDVNDSMDVSVKKLKQVTASLAPVQARRDATIKFGQNLILEHGVINQIYTGKTDAFAARKLIGVTNTFIRFDYESKLDPETGRMRHRILPTSIASWRGVDNAAAQKFLNDSGYETFMAEYQNDFSLIRQGRVFREFDRARHAIPRRLFEKKFGIKTPGPNWRGKAAADIGYSKVSRSAWLWDAVSPKNTKLPGFHFIYRTLTFTNQTIDDQAERIWEEMFPDAELGKRHFEARTVFTDYPELFRLLKTKPRCSPHLQGYRYNPKANTYELDTSKMDLDQAITAHVERARSKFSSQVEWWEMSHEKTGEQGTLAQKYGLPINKTKNFGVETGASEANHLLRGDYTQPHPFFDDEPLLDADNNPTGLYRLGCPFVFFIFDDDQEHAGTDRACHTFFQQLEEQRWSQEQLTRHGYTQARPLKVDSDCGDAFRMWAANFALPDAEPETAEEEFTNRMEEIRRENRIDQETDHKKRQQQLEYARHVAEQELILEHGVESIDELREDDDLDLEEVTGDDGIDRWWED